MTPVWLVLPDPFSSRLFFDTGIVDRLREALGDGLEVFLLDTGEQAGAWQERAKGIRSTTAADLLEQSLPLPGKIARRVDEWLDRKIGFYPLSLRHSLRHGFNRERLRAGAPELVSRSRARRPAAALGVSRSGADALALRTAAACRRRRSSNAFGASGPRSSLANIQMHAVVPFIVGGLRLGLPLVGHVASWDHTVGKGIVSPGLRRYVVQNESCVTISSVTTGSSAIASSSPAGRRRTCSIVDAPVPGSMRCYESSSLIRPGRSCS